MMIAALNGLTLAHLLDHDLGFAEYARLVPTSPVISATR